MILHRASIDMATQPAPPLVPTASIAQDEGVQTQTFTPDDLYCVYCHAPAAGPCAVCGALCCGDCVEVAMGLTVERAVCKPCLEQGLQPPGALGRRWVPALLVGLALGALTLGLLALG